MYKCLKCNNGTIIFEVNLKFNNLVIIELGTLTIKTEEVDSNFTEPFKFA